MFLKNWVIIGILGIIGIGLGYYWLSLPATPEDVVTMGDDTMADTIQALAALAGSVTTLGGAIFGVLGKLNDYRKAKLEIEEKKLELEQKRQKLGNA